jgi:hypothetical protein
MNIDIAHFHSDQGWSTHWKRAEIDLVVPFLTRSRLDRLLASELGFSRSRLWASSTTGNPL